ncbi:MAG TPA: adenine-specific methyltransferase EcoRI family protein [Succinivibrionaceae bacterium]|nr:adenine-specific methyltransferase EcoRI family protein [Succinivibrionaceae bacterium]
MSNSLLNAKKAKNDEFYTQLPDIENELKHYKEHFKNKVVFCNCDDPFESNFFKYFAMNFNALGLKKLIATSYASSPIVGSELNNYIDSDTELLIQNKKAYKVIMSELKDTNGDGREDLFDVQELIKHRIRYLKGDGDFRSDESIELLKQADIVVTNPPFSLFREYVSLLMAHKKKFVIIGSQNAIAYKEIFPLIKNNQLWLGWKAGDMAFKVPHYYPPRDTRYWEDKKGQKWRSLGNICWFTNLDIAKRHEKLELYKKYNSEDYPKYFNYDGIDVDKVDSIPEDYDGVMGVPITFLDKFNPDQFEIIGMGSDVPKTLEHVAYKKENKIVYEKDGEIYWQTEYSVQERKLGNSLRIEKKGLPDKAPFNRILIRRRK